MIILLKIASSVLYFMLCYFTGASLDRAEKQGRGPFNMTRLLIYLSIPIMIYMLWASPMIKDFITNNK